MEVSKSATSGFICDKNDISTILESCRVCMARDVNMSFLFTPESPNIVDDILFCTGITLKKDDGLPTNICTQCLNDLSIALKFKTSCLLADETFRKLILTENIKSEAVDQSTDDYDVSRDYETLDDFEDKVKTEVELDSVLGVQQVGKKRNVKRELTKSKAKSVNSKRPRLKEPKPVRPRVYRKYKFTKLYCEPCDVKFDNKQECDTHKRQVHKESEHWICEICGKQFVHRASHYSHIKSHLPPTYCCDQCDYKTWHKHDLIKHIRIHTGVKLYQCEFCTCSYYTSSNLTNHRRRVHMNQRQTLECHICHRSFYDKSKLNRHIDSHNEIKRFQCEVCHSRFSRRCYWKKHLLRQHDIITPRQRPGRQKVNAVVGEDIIKPTHVKISDVDKEV